MTVRVADGDVCAVHEIESLSPDRERRDSKCMKRKEGGFPFRVLRVSCSLLRRQEKVVMLVQNQMSPSSTENVCCGSFITSTSKSTAPSLVLRNTPLSSSLESISHSEKDHALQASNLLWLRIGCRIHIRHNRILSLGHLFGNLDALRQRHRALLQRTREIHIPDLIAEVGFLFDERDETVFDLEKDFGARFDVFGEGARGLDGHVGAGVRWVGIEVDVVDCEDIVGWVAAESQRVLPRHSNCSFISHSTLVMAKQTGDRPATDGGDCAEQRKERR